MNLHELTNKLLENPEFAKEYYREDDLEFDVSEMIIDARIRHGIPQEVLAKRMNTTQSAIARAESGKILPSLRFLNRVADAINEKLEIPRFVFSLTSDVNFIWDMSV